jgi:hypothetical protein
MTTNTAGQHEPAASWIASCSPPSTACRRLLSQPCDVLRARLCLITPFTLPNRVAFQWLFEKNSSIKVCPLGLLISSTHFDTQAGSCKILISSASYVSVLRSIRADCDFANRNYHSLPTMGNVWQLADIEEEMFAAAASLFAIHTQQQSVCRPPLTLPAGDDDSSSEEDVNDDWRTTIPCEKFHRANEHNLRDKFLDRLSEVLAREKTAHSRQKQSKAKHVAAAAWINSDYDSPITILLAKNEGLDERDHRLLGRLQTWLRAISATGKAPAIGKDVIWVGLADKEGLIEYSRSRLEFYVSQISQCKLDVGTLGADASPTGRLQRLCWLCSTFDNSPTVSALGEIVNLAYELRCTDWRHLDQTHCAKVVKAVLMLSRIRVAYECFKTTAFSFPEFGSVELKSAGSPYGSGIDVTRFRKQMRGLAESIGRKRLVKSNCARRYLGASWLHVHAEMQILVNLESKPKWRQSTYRYIGTSKRLCFLCHELLRNYVRLSADGIRIPVFRARMSHGKVYPLWTLPLIPADAECSFGLSIAAALIQTHRDVLHSLFAKSTVLQPAIAESSVGMSQSAAFVGKTPNKLKREHLAREREANSCALEDNSEFVFGPKVDTVQVIQLPADGSKPKLVPIAFHALPPESGREVPEFGFYLAPDFRIYWSSCHLDRKFRCCTVEKQAIKDIEGSYWIYRNENAELPENAYIKRMLDIDRISPSRRFYYGDLFIVKFTEHSKTSAYAVHDIPEASLVGLTTILEGLLSKEWADGFLESELQREQYFAAQELKLETDKEILYQRMYVISKTRNRHELLIRDDRTPVERELLERMPPNTLEWLAMQLCDDDALVSTDIKPSGDPSMARIEVVKRSRALDLMGCTGFQSSQL